MRRDPAMWDCVLASARRRVNLQDWPHHMDEAAGKLAMEQKLLAKPDGQCKAGMTEETHQNGRGFLLVCWSLPETKRLLGQRKNRPRNEQDTSWVLEILDSQKIFIPLYA
jgi:hypothetical protein